MERQLDKEAERTATKAVRASAWDAEAVLESGGRSWHILCINCLLAQYKVTLRNTQGCFSDFRYC